MTSEERRRPEGPQPQPQPEASGEASGEAEPDEAGRTPDVVAATLEALQARVAPEQRDALRGAAPPPPGEDGER
jgi:hypothetical protein